MDIRVKDFGELINQLELLDNESTLSFDINNGCLSYSIIISNARSNSMGNTMMFINNAIEVIIQGLNFLHKQVTIPLEMAEYYLTLLNNAEDKNIVYSVKLLMDKQLKVDDIIEWENGKLGIIISPKSSHNGQICYRLVKKNGGVGAREFILYRRTQEYNYRCRNREFKDYSLL